MLNKTIVINLFGEPGVGKSTQAMDITARLKRKGVNAEYVSEFAKDKVYEENDEVFKHQEYLFGKQSFKLARVAGKVDVIVVDSPLPLCVIYNQNEVLGDEFNNVVMNVFNSYDNRNYLLTRKHEYKEEGRFQNEEESKEVRNQIVRLLDDLHIDYEKIISCEDNCELIASKIAKEVLDRE